MSAFTNKANKFTSLKLSFNGEIRRLPIHSQGMTYQCLLEKTLSVFPHLGPIQFSWVDDENDTVVISSDAELAEALRIMSTGKKGYLRFTVLSTTPPTTASGNQPVTSHVREYGTITHAGVCCNECGASPLTGARFKCSGRENYDLCEPCEGFISREPYPTFKIYRPDQFSEGLSVFVDEKGGPKRGTQTHRGITCNGCHTRNFKGPRFKCTKRPDFNLCQACEVLDSHKHIMVKMYPQHSHMTVNIVADVMVNSLSADILPVATCHFRHGLYKRHSTHKTTDQKATTRRAGWRNGKRGGRHCWDRSSVAAAAAQRARAKQEENDFLEDQLVEMCINATKQELNTPSPEVTKTPAKSPVRAHCWDRSSIAKAAAERARRMSLDDYQWVQRATPVVEKHRPRQFPFLRKGCGRHNWDRFSPRELKNKADSSKIKRQRKGVIQEMLRLQEGKEDVHLEKSLLTMYHDSHIQNQRTNQSMASRLSSDITKGNQGLKWVVAASDADGKMGSTKDHNHPQVTDSTFKKAVKWVITEESPPKPPKRPSVSLSVANVSSGVSVPPPSAPPVAEVDRIKAALKAKQEHIQKVTVDQEKRQQKQRVEQEEKKKELQMQLEERKRDERLQQEKQFNDEVSAWGHELEVLCDMGFNNLQQLIPLLKTHVPTPASSLEPGAPLCEDGLQQVVMSLLAARN